MSELKFHSLEADRYSTMEFFPEGNQNSTSSTSCKIPKKGLKINFTDGMIHQDVPWQYSPPILDSDIQHEHSHLCLPRFGEYIYLVLLTLSAINTGWLYINVISIILLFPKMKNRPLGVLPQLEALPLPLPWSLTFSYSQDYSSC